MVLDPKNFLHMNLVVYLTMQVCWISICQYAFINSMHHVTFWVHLSLIVNKLQFKVLGKMSLSIAYGLLRIVLYKKRGRLPIVCSSWIFSPVMGMVFSLQMACFFMVLCLVGDFALRRFYNSEIYERVVRSILYRWSSILLYKCTVYR